MGAGHVARLAIGSLAHLAQVVGTALVNIVVQRRVRLRSSPAIAS